MSQLPGGKAANGGIGGPIDWVQDLLAARKARQEVEAVLEKEKEAEERARRGMSWSQKADVFLSVAKIGVVTVPVALFALVAAPALQGAGAALKGTGDVASEGAKAFRNLNTARKNPLPISWKQKRKYLLALKARYWKLADVPSLSRGGGTPEQWFLQGVGQGINDVCIVREECFAPSLFRQTIENRRALCSDAARSKDEKAEAFHRGYAAGMRAAIEYLSEPAYGPPQVAS